MNNLNLKLEGAQMLTKAQMKLISGGKAYGCYILNEDGSRSDSYYAVTANNGCQAQATADAWAYSGNSGYCCGFDCDYPGEICD